MKLVVLTALLALAHVANSAPLNLFGLQLGSSKDKAAAKSDSKSPVAELPPSPVATSKDKPASVSISTEKAKDQPAPVSVPAGTSKDQPASVSISAGTSKDQPSSVSLSAGTSKDQPASLPGATSRDKPASVLVAGGIKQDKPASVPADISAVSKDKPALPQTAADIAKDDKLSAGVAIAAKTDVASDFVGPKIEFAALKKGLDEKKLTVIDVRSAESIAKNGKVPGTFNVPFAEVEDAFNKLSKEEFRAKYGFDKPSPPGDNVVFMCHGGGTAKNAILILRKYGYSNLIWYEGSFIDWLANNGPVIKTADTAPVAAKSGLDLIKPALPSTKPALHEQSLDNLPDAHLGEPAKIEFEQLKAGVEIKKYTIIDVRPTRMFQEDGNIPGAFNLPLSEVEFAFVNMADSEFKTKYGFNRPSKPGTNVVVTCRSGRTARIALSILRPLGYTDMLWHYGGFNDWKAKGGAIIQSPAPAAGVEQRSSAAVNPDATKQTKPAILPPATSDEKVPQTKPAILPPVASDEKVPQTKPAVLPSKDSQGKIATDGKAVPNAPAATPAVNTDADAADPRRDNKFQVQTKPADISDIFPEAAKKDGTDAKKLADSFSVKVVMFEELERLLEESPRKLVVVDMSIREEYKKKHIKGSFNLPIDELESLSKLSDVDFQAKYGFSKPKPPGRNLVITARSGCNAFKAVHKAISKGGSSLMWYVPGVDDWVANKGAIEGTEAGRGIAPAA